MSIESAIPKEAAISINDMLEHCAKIQPGQEVVILAHVDGLNGGDNLVDPKAISWIQSAVQMRGANPSVLWIDEPAKPHAWRFPPVVKAALAACDVFCTLSYSDGNNISLNEAMACGCFPIASRIPANEEWIIDGENGFLVPVDDPQAVADAICRALADSELRERAAIINWKIIQERGLWRKSMERMEAVYQKLKLQGRNSTIAEDSFTRAPES